MSDAAVFFASGGGESIETAVKLVRRYWSLVGRDEKTIVISRERAYHGLAGYGTSLVGMDAFTVGVGPLAGDMLQVPWNDAAALAAAIDHVGPERVAAFFCEPIVGAGGVLLPPPGYLEEALRVCRERDVLFVADEVICGFCRVGDWFASTRFGLDPDLVTFAKGVTSGYLPLGGVIVGARVREPFWTSGAGVWRHGYTYSGHATATAAAHANLDIMEREGLAERALALESELEAALAPLASHGLVGEVRAGLGVVAAVQLAADALAARPALADRVLAAAREHGVLARGLAGGSLQISPALTIDSAGLAELVSGLGAALDDVAARPSRGRPVWLAAAPAAAREPGRRSASTGNPSPGSQWSLCLNASLTSLCPVRPRRPATRSSATQPAHGNAAASADVGDEVRCTLQHGSRVRIGPVAPRLAREPGELHPDRVPVAAARMPRDVRLADALDHRIGVDAVVGRHLRRQAS